MSAGKMTPDEFERICRAFRDALKKYDGSDLTGASKLELGEQIYFPNGPDIGKAMGGYGKQSFGIPAGEWSIIKAIQEGK